MDEPELTIERLVAGGDGLAREEAGRVVFVSAAAPGDRVRVRLTTNKKDFAKAEIIELLDGGPGRVDAPCPEVARGCGGCGWQHVDIDTAREAKAELLVESARRLGHFEVDIEHGAALPTESFRTNVRVAATGAQLGFRKRQSHDVVDVARCMVTHPLLDEVLAVASLTGADETTLRCSPSTGQRLAILHGGAAAKLTGAPADLVVVTDEALDAGENASLVHEVAETRFEVSARSFFQTSHVAAEALVAAVRTQVADSAGRLVDLYGGVGLFAATCAPDREIVVVESSPSSAADARTNLADLSATVVTAQVENWIAPKAGVVVADPPRAGLRSKGVARVVATEAPLVVLISCDAASFARDVAGLVAAGYRVVQCQLLDLFPYTHHVEVVTTLRR